MYAAHFGLAVDPFSLSPDPAFLYQSPVHAEALAGLRLALQSRRGLTTLIGEVGTGKTTLLYALLRDAEPTVCAAYLANTKLGFVELLRQALADWGVAPVRGGRLALLEALHDFLRRCDAEGRIAALVVDEAQNLDADTFEHLRLLTNYETYSAKLLQIVLVGQPELAAALRRPELRQIDQRIAYRCHLGPLSLGESQRYLDHRLTRAGGTPRLLTASARVILAGAARGLPRRLNVLGHTALLLACGRGATQVAAGDVWAALRTARRGGGRRRLPIAAPVWRGAAWATAVAVLAAAGVAAGIARFGAIPPPRDPVAAPVVALAAPAIAEPAPAVAVVAAPPRQTTVVVGKGQTLSAIARRHLGSGGPQAIRRLRAANPQLGDLDRITAGDVLRLPPAAAQGGQG